MKTGISACVITFNEEGNIRDCLESLRWVDEVVVVDSGSTDRTVEIAREFGANVVHHPWPGYVAQKNFAIEATTGEWVLCVDADERCTPELRTAIEKVIESPGHFVGFEVRRHVRYLGRWINHGGWYPDWKVRLVRHGRARWEGTDPHDKLTADGATGRLDADLIHFTYRSFSDQIRTIDRFSDVAATEWSKDGRRFSLIRALFHPPVKFLECYLWKRGFLDGWPGLVIAVASSFYVFAKYVKLWEMRRTDRGDKSNSPSA